LKRPIKKEVSPSISAFLSNNPHFDFATSRIHDFDNEIAAASEQRSAAVKSSPAKKASSRDQAASGQDAKATAAEHVGEVRSELMKMQRVFQISTTP
jgi:hypothetical protein